MLPILNVMVPLDQLTNDQLIDWVRIKIGKDPIATEDGRGRKKE